MAGRTGCLTQEAIRRLLDSANDPSDAALTANAHLADCPDCRRLLRETAAAPDRFVRLLTPAEEDAACLESDLILRYVHGQTDSVENDIVDLHQEDCQFCRADILALQQLRHAMETEEQQEVAPALAGSGDVAVVRTPIPEGAVVAGNTSVTDARASKDAVTSWWKRLWAKISPTPASPQPVAVESEHRSPSWSQKFASSRNSLTLLTAGAVIAACLVYILIGMPLRRQLTAQREAHNKQTTALKQQIATLEQAARETGQDRERLQADLLKEQQKHGLFLNHPQLAFASEIRRNLEEIKPTMISLLGTDHDNGIPFKLDYPVARFVATPAPTFRWQALKGATYYRVDLTDLKNRHDLEPSPPIYGTQWTPSKPLAYNRIYSWQVVAYKQEGKEETELKRSYIAPMNLAKFKVLDQATAEILKRFADSPLTLGILYAETGMPYEAEESLKQLPAASRDSALVRQLLKDVQTLKQQKQTIQKGSVP